MGGWSETDTAAWLKAAAAGSLLVVGYQFIIVAMRVGDISAVAPFRYTALLWAHRCSASSSSATFPTRR